VYNAPQFAEREAVEKTVCSRGGVRTRWRTEKTDVFGPSYYVVYKTICYFVFRNVGPLLVLLVLNARLVLALNRRGRRRRRLDRGSAVAVDDTPASTSAAVRALSTAVTSARQRNLQRENITLMLVVVVFVFIVCQLPDMALRIIAVYVSCRCCLCLCY